MLYKIIRSIISFFFKNFVIRKKVKNSEYFLHYRISQNLNFLFKRKIQYESTIQDSILDFINPEDLIFDIGGNIGQYSLFFCSITKDKGRVVSFEPNKECYDFLNFNLNYNNIKNVETFNIGVGHKDITESFYEDNITGGRLSSFHKEINLKISDSKIKIKKLDTIINEIGEPNFIKVDVEGYEINVLKGLNTDLKNCKFLVEVRKDTKEFVLNYFKNKNYKVYQTDNGLKEITYSSILPDFCNLLFVK